MCTISHISSPPNLDKNAIDALIRQALAEDLGSGDVTTLSLISAGTQGRAAIISKSACCIAGAAIAAQVFEALNPKLKVEILVKDGKYAEPGQTVLTITGEAASILSAERVALNFIQRLTGIATLTATFVAKTKKYQTTILDTRKTTPTLRSLEKYAVWCGGGRNHRFGLFDMILIKDNHRRFYQGPNGLAAAIEAARLSYPSLPIEIEVENEEELRDALRAEPDWIMLDNMTPERLRASVKIVAGRCKLEASGGITAANIVKIAATGVDAVSLGCLTHSAPAADLALDLL